jgi:hypothetical protein
MGPLSAEQSKSFKQWNRGFSEANFSIARIDALTGKYGKSAAFDPAGQ